MLKSGFPICNRNAIYFSFRFLFCFVFVRFIYSFLGVGEGVGNMTELFSGISRKTRELLCKCFFSDYALIVKSEIRIANPNRDFLCMCCTCSARAI